MASSGGDHVLIHGVLANPQGRDMFLKRYAQLMETILNEAYIISAIDELQQDTANYKYYSVWHNVDVFALKSAPSEWGNPGRATIEADDFGSQYVVTTVGGTKLYYSSTGVGTLPLVDGCTYAILVD